MKLAIALRGLQRSGLEELLLNRRLMKSIRRLRRLARLEAGSFQVHFQLGLAYARVGAISDASDSFHRAVFLNPQHHPIWTELGIVEARRGRIPEARKAFETALELQPGDATVEAHVKSLESVDWLPRTLKPLRSRSSFATLVGSLRQQRQRLQRG